jgi:quinohemoprotein ethanol dehydrogenase
VRGGALESRGMPAFAELSDAELQALQHYIRQRARTPPPSAWNQLGAAWGYVKLLVKMELAKRGWL